MTVKKLLARNSREALKLAREQLGSGAVILSTRQTDAGVEILAAGEQELAELIGATHGASSPSLPKIKPQRPLTASGTSSAPADSRRRETTHDVAAFSPPRIVSPHKSIIASPPAPDDRHLMDEIKSMRGMLEERLASLAWDDSTRRRPLRVKLLQTLLSAGFSPALARHITERLPDDYSASQADDWLVGVLAKNVAAPPISESLVDRGGVYALVGPTGVGKTTTTAKLAARCAVKYGANKLGLITTDHYRIGAQDQLRIYGKILGVAVHCAQDEASLMSVLSGMRDKHLVLIDTVGMGQRDARIAEQTALLSALPVQRILLLSSTCQSETLDDVARGYRCHGLSGAIVTKLDEAVKLGGALDVLIRHRLTLHFVTNGQRVPEDLHLIKPEVLVHRALQVNRRPEFTLNEEEHKLLLAGTFAVPSQAA
jgi:flagellar biosynthesis protein FlhF